jgi:hypothetical protein
MAGRTMAERKRRAADRDTRRGSMLVLISRVQRGVPTTPAEGSLLRAHVEVEVAESNELRATVNGQQKEIQRQGTQLEAAHDAIREAERRAERAEAAYARAHRLSATWRVSRDANTRHAGYELASTLDKAPRTTDTTPEQQP